MFNELGIDFNTNKNNNLILNTMPVIFDKNIELYIKLDESGKIMPICDYIKYF